MPLQNARIDAVVASATFVALRLLHPLHALRWMETPPYEDLISRGVRNLMKCWFSVFQNGTENCAEVLFYKLDSLIDKTVGIVIYVACLLLLFLSLHLIAGAEKQLHD